MGRPTDNDWNAFKFVSNDDKAKVLYSYLCEGYNMNDVAKYTLGDSNDRASERVSNITRCYGFHGRNSGDYSGKDIELADIKKFVNKHPNGCDDRKVLDDYIKKLLDDKSKKKDKEKNNSRDILDSFDFDNSYNNSSIQKVSNDYSSSSSSTSIETGLELIDIVSFLITIASLYFGFKIARGIFHLGIIFSVVFAFIFMYVSVILIAKAIKSVRRFFKRYK